jgi:hypothetical protein
MTKKMNLQLFADGDNQKLPARDYQLEFKELLQAVFAVQAYFADFFGGDIEAIDGVQENETAFYVKTSDIPVVVGTAYSKDANTAFGTGTGKSSRFGNRTEIIYKDTPVKYTDEYVFHEGIDRHTVNNDFDAAVADRLELQARAKTTTFNTAHGKFISASAGKTIAGGASITKDNVADVFNQLSKHFVNVGAIGTKVAKVTADVYNAIVDSGLSTTAKNADVNVADNEARKFKGFLIEEVPDSLFQTNEVIYAYIAGIGKAFTGIETARTIESEDFDGVALQGAGKFGEFILPDNKQAVAKVTVTGA